MKGSRILVLQEVVLIAGSGRGGEGRTRSRMSTGRRKTVVSALYRSSTKKLAMETRDSPWLLYQFIVVLVKVEVRICIKQQKTCPLEVIRWSLDLEKNMPQKRECNRVDCF